MAERWLANLYPLLREYVRAASGRYPEHLPEPDEADEFKLNTAESQLASLCALQADPLGAVRYLEDVHPTFTMCTWDAKGKRFVPLLCYDIAELY
jgi:hypothetical protein